MVRMAALLHMIGGLTKFYFFSRQGPLSEQDITREELDLNTGSKKGSKDLPHFPKRRGKCRRQALKFAANPEKPDLNNG